VIGTQNITLTAGATQTSTFTWNTAGSAVGSNTITVTASKINQNVQPDVTSTPQTFSLSSSPPPFFSGSLLYIIVGIIIAAIVAIALVLLMRRRSKSTTI
jgi:subtilase family serine protease